MSGWPSKQNGAFNLPYFSAFPPSPWDSPAAFQVWSGTPMTLTNGFPYPRNAGFVTLSGIANFSPFHSLLPPTQLDCLRIPPMGTTTRIAAPPFEPYMPSFSNASQPFPKKVNSSSPPTSPITSFNNGETGGEHESKPLSQEGEGKPLRCILCNVSCRLQNNLDDHCKGKQHLRRLRFLQKRSVGISGISGHLPIPVPDVELRRFFYGLEIDFGFEMSFLATLAPDSIQYVTFRSPNDAQTALAYAKRLLTGVAVDITPAYQKWECNACDIALNSPAQYEQHLLSRRHQRKIQNYIDESTVEVTGLTPFVREVDLRELFCKFSLEAKTIDINLSEIEPNEIRSMPIIKQIESAITPSLLDEASFSVQCRVRFDSPREAQRALRVLGGYLFDGKPLGIMLAKPTVQEGSESNESD